MSLSLPLQCCAFRQAFRSPQKICIGISKSHELIRISRSARLSVGSVVRATRNEKRRLKHCPQPEINPSALLQGSHTSSLTANLPRGTTGVQTRTPQRWPETQTQLGSPSLRCFSTKRTKKPSDQNPSAPSQTELNKIFGQKVDREKAVQLLLKLQEQRRRGTLDQGLDFPPEWVDRGLTYLRAKYPLDEDAAILARLDREIDGDWSSPQTNPERSRSGQSGLQEIRRINREKQLAEKAAQEAKEKEKEQLLVKAHQEKQNDQSLRALVTKKRNDAVIDDGYIRRPGLPAMPAWVAKYYDEASERHIPQMSKAQRLIPCALFTVGAVGIALLIAQVYEPPAPSARIFPNMSPAAAAVGAIVAANCVVFLLWRVPRLWKFMNMHFMMVPAIPRPFQLLGSEFSHQEFSHLLANMVGIWFVGTHRESSFTLFCHSCRLLTTIIVHDDIGRGRFIALVICGCIIPSFCSLTAYVMNSIFITATVGASGLLCTMLGVSCILHEGYIQPSLPYPLLFPSLLSLSMQTSADSKD